MAKKCNPCESEKLTTYYDCEPCPPKEDCSCPIFIGTECVTLNEDLPCSGIEKGILLSEALTLLDTFICEGLSNINPSITLTNIGTGLELYAGKNISGKEQIRTILTTSNILTSQQNTNDITLGIDENTLTDFINENQESVTASSLGNGSTIYKGITTPPIANNKNFEFKSLKYTDQPGTGVSIINGLEDDGQTLNLKVKKLISPDIQISYNDNEITLKLPTSLSIPAIYVNNSHVISESEFNSLGGLPYKGDGSLSKPKTDTITGFVGGIAQKEQNTAIQNALEHYVGTGTPSNPQRLGDKIIVLNNNSTHIFNGNLNYKGLNLVNEGRILSTTTGYLLDMREAVFSNTETITIENKPSAVLSVLGEGFRNDGNNIGSSTYTTGKTVRLIGGKGLIYSTSTDINKYLINASIDNNQNNNDGSLAFVIYCDLAAEFQGITKVGGKARVDLYGELQSGVLTAPVNPSLRAFHQTGGEVRLFNTSRVVLYGGTRDDAFTFNTASGLRSVFIASGAVFAGTATSLFNRLSFGEVNLQVVNSPSGYGLIVTDVFNYIDKKWEVIFNQNNIAQGKINSGLVDLTMNNTVGAINTINNQIVETLRKYPSKELARINLTTERSAYVVERNVPASELIEGVEYLVVTAGSPSIGTAGTYVIANSSMRSSNGGIGLLTERCVKTL